MLYAIETIAALIGARREGDRDARIDRLLTDSRSLAFPETTLFFALRTKVGDGADYINELYRCGVRNFVVAELSVDLKAQCPEANFLIVTNPLKALQRLAERHREEYDVPVVGVTGSNGKTVVKEWLYQLLSPAGHVTRSPRSYNSQIGVPLSVWLLDERTRLAVFEAGISRPDEMASLRAMIQPTIGVITNLGPAHQENFCSISEKGLEKVSLFKDAEVIIYSEDDDTIQECVDEIAPRAKRLAWSRRNTRSALYVQEVVSNGNETEISYIYNQEQGRFTIPFTDAASVENAITCLAVCCYLEPRAFGDSPPYGLTGSP